MFLIFFYLSSYFVQAQPPSKLSFQAVIRDSSGDLVPNQSVGLRMSILQGGISGSSVYTETHNAYSNSSGLISIEIGGGTIITGDFSSIDWSNGPYYLQREVDPTGGTNYTISGTSQLLTVPYALHAKTAETVTGGITETDPIYSASEAAKIDADDITNLSNLSGTNTGDQDVSSLATKIALSDSTGQVRSEIPDVSGFLTSETDPIYSASEAAKIDATDITNLSNLSGTNTGDQDVSSLATKTALSDSTGQVRSEIPDVSGFLTSEQDGDTTNEIQNLSVSTSGDTLYLSGGNYVIIPGISAANPPYASGTVYCGTPTTIVDVTSITGEIWMDRNLGASQVATDSFDVNSYGDLYQWGRAADGHQCRTSDTTSTLSNSDTPVDGKFITSDTDWRNPSNDNLWQGVNGTNNPCPNGYRLPTAAEWTEERNRYGIGITPAFDSPLKLPAAGYRNKSNGQSVVEGLGYYWSSTVISTNAKVFQFWSGGGSDTGSYFRARGGSVRCIKHE
jgi:hypothetical protein